MSTPQPPAPPKWAMEAALEIHNLIWHGFSVGHAPDNFAAIIQRHHAAAQAETVALLEILVRYVKLAEPNPSLRDKIVEGISDCLAQLKEGAP